MELEDRDKTGTVSVVSGMEEQGSNTNEAWVINQSSVLLSDFTSNMYSLMGKYDAKLSDYWSRMDLVLDNLNSVDHQIHLAKKGFRKRMRSAVDTSNQLSEKIRKIGEKALEEQDLDEVESDLEDEGEAAGEEEAGEEEDDANFVNEESDENAIEEELEDGEQDADEEEEGDGDD
eukprot:gene19174-21809_t